MSKKSQNSGREQAGRLHVISRDSGWAVKKEGTFRAGKVYSNKDAAVKDAKSAATRGQDIIVHKKDGSIQKWEKAK